MRLTEEDKLRIKTLNGLRDKMLRSYTAKNKRIDEGFQTEQESKKETDKMKGYASVDFLIQKDRENEIIGEIREFLDSSRDEIEAAGVFSQYGRSTYKEDPENYEIIEFALELNEGDYLNLRRALSDREEVEMRSTTNAADLYEEEMAEERRMGGPRHY